MLSSFHGGGLCRATGNIMPRQGEKARPACNIPDRIRLFNLLDLQLGRQRKRPGLARGNDIPPVLFYPGVFHCTWFPAIKNWYGIFNMRNWGICREKQGAFRRVNRASFFSGEERHSRRSSVRFPAAEQAGRRSFCISAGRGCSFPYRTRSLPFDPAAA